MLKKIDKLENQLTELRLKISPAAFEQWLASTTTKTLKAQLELDIEELKDNWVSSGYDGNPMDEAKARGQAEYAEGLLELIPLILSENND